MSGQGHSSGASQNRLGRVDLSCNKKRHRRGLFLFRNPACACFGRDSEIGFVLPNSKKEICFTGSSARIALEAWKLSASAVSHGVLVDTLASAGLSPTQSAKTLERMKEEMLLLSGGPEDPSTLFGPRRSENPICRNLVVCMTGAIQSSNFGVFLLSLKTCFCEQLKIILTESAREFVQAKSLQHLCASKVYCDPFDDVDGYGVPHIYLSRWASCLLIAPATAASLHRIAHGTCNDLLSLTVAAAPRETPVVIAPSMNQNMWRNPAVQENVTRCQSMGYWIIEPGFGSEVSSGNLDVGIGGFGAQLSTLPTLMAHIVSKHLRAYRP